MDNLHEGALHVCQTLAQAGHRALLAGGCVRDMVLSRTPRDYDIATSAKPAEVAALFPKTIPVGEAFGVQRVILPQGIYEVSTFRQDGPYLDGRHPVSVSFASEREDARRRDFTVNALFYDPQTSQVVDYVHGQDDIHNQIIRAVGDPRQRFQEDHLRLIRAVRFAARLQFQIEPATMEALRALAPLITRTSPERLRDELTKMLTEGQARHAFELLDQTGLLHHVLPEVARMKGVEQPPEFHPEGDVFTHTLLLLQHLQKPAPPLAWAALLHDVGKPLTQTFEDRIRFNNHDKVGARESEKICRRLHFSNSDTKRVAWLVEQHMRLAAAPNMRESKLKRFVREDAFPELLELHRLDCLASHAKLDLYQWLNEYKATLKPEEIRPTPLLTGHNLIEMGYTPGPLFGEILADVEDAQLEGQLTSHEQAKSFVAQHWPRPAATTPKKNKSPGEDGR